jgi:hypothetical protein
MLSMVVPSVTGKVRVRHHVDGSAVLAASGASKSDDRWATACGTEGSTTRDDGGAHGVVADPELRADLDQGEAVGIQAGCLLTNRLRQRWRTGFEPGAPRDLTDGATMHLEADGQLPDGHPVGVRSEQVGSIRGTQTGLSLSRISADGAALIGDLGGS